MATEITSAPVISISMSAQMQNSAIQGNIAITFSAPAAMSNNAMTGSVEISIINTQEVGYPTPGTESTWTMFAEVYEEAPGIAVTLPALSFTATGYDSATGVLTLTLPSQTFSGIGSDASYGTLSVTLPALTTLFSAAVNETGTLSIALPALTATLSGERGVVGELTITLPALNWAASLYSSVEGTLAVSIPIFSPLFLSAPQDYHSLVLNLKNYALTEFDNYDFNSLCRFNGKSYGASSTKIYELDSGETDNGTLVDWNMKTPYLDLDQKFKNKLGYAWIGYKSNGNIVVTACLPDGTEYEYPLEGVEITESGIKVKFGKGIRSKYLALELQSVDGSTMTLDAIRLPLEKGTKVR
jgi:hypothetical protein